LIFTSFTDHGLKRTPREKNLDMLPLKGNYCNFQSTKNKEGGDEREKI
jgi:hypothetical protein